MKLLLLVICLLCPLTTKAADARLINALVQVESSGRDKVVGDAGKAYGALQIHASMVEDVNRIYGTTYTHKDMFDRNKAIDVCHKYLAFYGSEKRLGHVPTPEDHARIWNGGPAGWKRKATQGYWAKVRRHL